MNTATSNNLAGSNVIGLPEDLRHWLPESRLLVLALECVAAIDLPAHGVRVFDAGQGIYSGPMLCTLLTFAYATGRLGAEELERQAENDRALRYLCANQCPDWHTLRRFRRAHRSVIGSCLERLLVAAGRERFAGRLWLEPMPDESVLVAECARSAEDRIRRAILADTASLDD
jgi:hypothetical protein